MGYDHDPIAADLFEIFTGDDHENAYATALCELDNLIRSMHPAVADACMARLYEVSDTAFGDFDRDTGSLMHTITRLTAVIIRQNALAVMAGTRTMRPP